ncbi:FprA family A-type flavoprotein [Clostridium sp.]|jgi:flavorubredoxin|uniref:FprA family A-type flavoprotein n=1 Tax=Clostridium sp. TaxID=1506 RepID=UPI0025C69586|nr:FprA family A-type flavoprotein [Clostridium sp.]MCI9069227.1 FprA family A-type flavoprotein [Clostridium sp.]
MANTFKITENLFWVGALDPNLRIFDIIMETKFGTSYNSYLLKGSQGIALFETVKEKFFDEHLEKIRLITNLEDINYIVVNHTEPDHAGSVEKLLEYAPNATVVGSSLAIKYLSEIINKPFNSKVVKDGETLSLGDKTLKFISAPQLHWPDTMYSYVVEDETLITCDSFGAHYCDDRILKSSIEEDKEDDYVEAYNYYFRMIMGPFKPFMLKAMDKIKDLKLNYICPGHGLVLDKSNIEKFMNLYKEWCQPTKREKQSIVIPYVTAYGYTETIAQAIKKGIESANFDVDILMYDLVTADMNEVLKEINECSGLLIGSPTLLADTLPQIWTILSSLNPVIHRGLPASCFGSYGWSGEALKNITERYKQLKLNVVSEPLGIIFKASEENLETAFNFGLDFAKKVLK